MLKDLFQYFKDHNRPEIVENGGHFYSTRSLTKLNVEQSVQAIQANSLTGLVDYAKSNFDTDRKFLIHVVSPTHVSLFDALNNENERRIYIQSRAMLPDITFGRFMDIESFVIQTQSKFIQNENTQSLLKFVGSIVEDDSKETKDNGISQAVKTKTGIATVGEAVVPNPVNLRPFRTFVEVPQPESSFVLRIQNGPRASLFEADGGAWEINAMHSIKEYLEEALSEGIESGKIVIIS